MSVQEHFAFQFAYHWGTNHRLVDLAAELNPADYSRSPDAGGRSIHDLFFHILATDAGWRGALQTGVRPAPIPATAFPDLASLRKGLADEERAWDAFLRSMDDEVIESEASLESRGRSMRLPRWRVLQHLILHGMQHHTELAQLLTVLGNSPGDLDFIFFT